MRRVCFVLVVSFVAILLSACGGSTGAVDPQTSSDAPQVNLVYYEWNGVTLGIPPSWEVSEREMTQRFTPGGDLDVFRITLGPVDSINGTCPWDRSSSMEAWMSCYWSEHLTQEYDVEKPTRTAGDAYHVSGTNGTQDVNLLFVESPIENTVVQVAVIGNNKQMSLYKTEVEAILASVK